MNEARAQVYRATVTLTVISNASGLDDHTHNLLVEAIRSLKFGADRLLDIK